MDARDAILEAAFQTLVQDGPELPASTVARRAETSKALVYHHFGSREGLLDAMAARVLQETQEGLARLAQDYPNPRERLDALARTLLEDPRQPPTHARRVLQFWLLTDASDSCRGALRDALLTDFVAQTVREGTATGALRPGTDAAALAGTLLARWHGLTTRFAMGGRVDFEREAETLSAEIADTGRPA